MTGLVDDLRDTAMHVANYQASEQSIPFTPAFPALLRQAADRIAWLEAGLQEIAGGLSVDRPCDIASAHLNREIFMYGKE